MQHVSFFFFDSTNSAVKISQNFLASSFETFSVTIAAFFFSSCYSVSASNPTRLASLPGGEVLA
jgi:hypothetical protein